MNEILNEFRSLLQYMREPAEDIRDERIMISSRIFLVSLSISIAIQLVFTCLKIILLPAFTMRYLSAYGISTLLTLILIRLALKNIHTAVIAFNVIYILFVGILQYTSGGLYENAYLGLIPIVMITGFTFGRVGALAALFLSCVEIIVISFFHSPIANLEYAAVEMYRPRSAVSIIEQLVTMTILSVMYTMITEKSLRNVRTRQKEISVLADALKIANHDLEEKVRVRTRELQSASEEVIGVNKELQNANEEMMAMNEELLASNEVVTSINEELAVANEKLTAKFDEISRLQSQMIASEKMASLGALVAGIAHEINTPLGNSLTALTFLQTDLECMGPNGPDLGQAQKAAQIALSNMNRAVQLIRSLKTVSADLSVDLPREVELKSYLEEVLTSLSPSVRKTGHILSFECHETIRLRTWPDALAQIVTNLVMNSLRHAFRDIPAGHMHLSVSCTEKLIRIAFSDDGIGMDEETANHAFDPFFTTSRDKGGTGLGLYIVHNLVVNRLAGEIHLETALGNGTRFKITFPVKDWKTADASAVR